MKVPDTFRSPYETFAVMVARKPDAPFLIAPASAELPYAPQVFGSPTVRPPFSGYLKDPEATEAAWAGGWFHTGDYIRSDAVGLLFFFDRETSIENIAVLEVESVLQQVPGVTPVPDDIRGEEVFAFVVAKPEAAMRDEASAEHIVHACAGNIAYHKLPGYLAFVDALPLSARKLARGEIKELAARAVSEGEAFDLRGLKAQLRKEGAR